MHKNNYVRHLSVAHNFLSFFYKIFRLAEANPFKVHHQMPHIFSLGYMEFSLLICHNMTRKECHKLKLYIQSSEACYSVGVGKWHVVLYINRKRVVWLCIYYHTFHIKHIGNKNVSIINEWYLQRHGDITSPIVHRWFTYITFASIVEFHTCSVQCRD